MPFKKSLLALSAASLMALSALMSAPARASLPDCPRVPAKVATITTIVAEKIMVRPRAQVGEPIGGWIDLREVQWDCKEKLSQTFRLSIKAQYGISDGGAKAFGGKGYALFRVEQNGKQVGFITEHSYTIGGEETLPFTPLTRPVGDEHKHVYDKDKSGGHHARSEVTARQRVHFIKTAQDKLNGTFLFPVAHRAIFRNDKVGGWRNPVTSWLQVTFEELTGTCTVRTPEVDLGTVYEHNIPQRGDVAAVSTDFAIRFEQCPAGYKAIRYRFEPGGGLTAANDRGVLTPDAPGAGQASGVGIQVLENDGTTPVVFSTSNYNYTLPGYDGKGSGTSAHEVPLKARFIRTADAVNPGDARAKMMVLVDYD